MPSLEEIQVEIEDVPAATSLILLPNVFVTPPEEEYDMPPWCCFDADRDALPGALPDEDIFAADFDYTVHGETEEELEDISVLARVTEGGDAREDIYVMHSLVAEAESLRERLRSLDLSPRSRSSDGMMVEDVPTDAVCDDEEDEDTFMPPSEPEQPQVRRNRSFFSFKPILRKKSPQNNSSFEAQPVASDGDEVAQGPTDSVDEFSLVDRPNSPGLILSEMNAVRRPSIFARLRKLSAKKSDGRPSLQLYKTSNALRSCETLTSPRSAQDAEQGVRRRFSFFDLPRRFSTSSQSTVPTTPGIMPSDELCASTSSLATSTVPPTPEAVMTNLSTSVGSPILSEASKKMPFQGSSDLMCPMTDSVENLAASLSLPTFSSTPLPTSFTLDALHFESLQFTSDDFP